MCARRPAHERVLSKHELMCGSTVLSVYLDFKQILAGILKYVILKRAIDLDSLMVFFFI